MMEKSRDRRGFNGQDKKLLKSHIVLFELFRAPMP